MNKKPKMTILHLERYTKSVDSIASDWSQYNWHLKEVSNKKGNPENKPKPFIQDPAAARQHNLQN